MNETIKNDSENARQDVKNSRLQRFAAWYKAGPVAKLLVAIKSRDKLTGKLSLLVAIAALVATIYEINQSQTVREATMFALVTERLSLARQMDSDKRATRKEDTKDGKVIWKCSSRSKQLSAREGQIPVLERMARLDPSLSDIVARDVNLVVARGIRDKGQELRGIDLKGADLSRADLHNTNLRNGLLSGATLTGAELDKSCLKDALLVDSKLINTHFTKSDLSGADLTKAVLTDADLYQANLNRATLTDAILENADISGANFKRAKGLTQLQLNSACADEDSPPINLPKENGEQLKWKHKGCE
ncbi:MAG: pentapeptide repeat-containing protein [Gammaproteobacteria bacterium]|nr:pentapeptide repeat-containing protein [Gammaproteobacteria bacterium]